MAILNLQTAIDLIHEMQVETYHRSTALYEAIEKYFGIPSEMVEQLYEGSLQQMTREGVNADLMKKFRAEYLAKLEAMYELGSDTPPRKQ